MKRDVFQFGVFLVLSSLLLIFAPSIMAAQSSNGAFNVTPDFLYVNWTSGAINVTSNVNNLTVVVDNFNTKIFSNYSQNNRYNIDDYKSLNDSTWYICFNSTANYNMQFRVQNETLSYTTTSQVLNKTNSTLFYLSPYMFCPPGKYYGYFYVKNSTNATENLTINVSFQIPVNEMNTFNVTTKSGFFRGSLLPNYNYYHSYYFNTSLADNFTALTITLGPSSSNDVDIFLYDSSGNYLSKSINRSSSMEEIVYNLPDTPEMYEVRVYGNVSTKYDYEGYLYFSTLNVTNASGSKLTSISFGELDANESSQNHTFVLKNEDDEVLTNVIEHKEIYHVDKWLNQSTDKTFKLLVPDFAQKVKIRLEWKKDAGENVTNWTLYLRDANGVLVGTSAGKYVNANKTTGSSVLEEYIEYSGSITTANDGFWNITVKNASAGSANLNNYNLTAYIYVPTTWLKTNYSTTTFNSSGKENSSRAVNVNITAPETNVLNGSYEGFLEYYQSSKWKIRIPFSFSVRTGTLIMNENLSTTSSKITHNVGFNTVSYPLVVKIPYNNTGGYSLYIRVENTTDNKLYQTGNNSNYADFVLSDFPTGPLNPGESGFLNISVKINTTRTHNKVGIYRGFILFNTTNSTNVTRQSSLFKTFNITLYLNLTDRLNVTITDIKPSYTAPTSAKNMTFVTVVKLINGTVISDTGLMSYTNFTYIRINETNITNYGSVLTGIGSGKPGGGSGCSSGTCDINATVPAGMVGGKYKVYMGVKWNTKMCGGTGEVNLTGVGVTNNFKINDTGIKLTAVSPMSFGEVNEGTQNLHFNMTVKNYGPVAITSASKGRIYFDEGACAAQLTTVVKNHNCAGGSISSNASGAYIDYEMNPFDAVGCYVRFEIDVSNISTSNKTCYITITSTNKKAFNKLENIYMKIMEVSTSEEGEGGEPTGGESGGCSSDSDCNDTYYCSEGACKAVSCPDGFVSNHKCNPYERSISITDYESKVGVVQGDSVTTEIGVENTGNVALDVKLSLTYNITGVTHTVTPNAYNIDPDETYSFAVKFVTSDTTKVGNHLVTVKAYAKDNEDISDTKTFYLSVEPLEETKREINQTYEKYKNLFESLKMKFLSISPTGVSDVNFTKTNRTYNSLVNMLNQVENYLLENRYADAADLLENINESMATFETQINQLLSESSNLIVGGIWTWVAIAVVIVVILAFLGYLLLPPKKGYHPVYGYRPPAKNPIVAKFSNIADKVKGLGKGIKKTGFKRDQTTLTQFERQQPPTPSKPYMKGYERKETYPYKRESIIDKLKKKIKME